MLGCPRKVVVFGTEDRMALGLWNNRQSTGNTDIKVIRFLKLMQNKNYIKYQSINLYILFIFYNFGRRLKYESFILLWCSSLSAILFWVFIVNIFSLILTSPRLLVNRRGEIGQLVMTCTRHCPKYGRNGKNNSVDSDLRWLIKRPNVRICPLHLRMFFSWTNTAKKFPFFLMVCYHWHFTLEHIKCWTDRNLVDCYF